MTLLLDTHAFLWFWWADPQLSTTASDVISNSDNRKLVSPASSWEIAIKVSLKKKHSRGGSRQWAVGSGRKE